MESYYLKNFEEPSELSRLFYSHENVVNLSNILRYQVFKHTQIKIGPVNVKKLLEQMTNIYMEYAKNSDSPEQIQRQLVQLNEKTTNSLKTTLISNVRDHLDNLQDLDNPNGVYLVPQPINVYKRKTTGNRGQADILFGDDFYK